MILAEGNLLCNVETHGSISVRGCLSFFLLGGHLLLNQTLALFFAHLFALLLCRFVRVLALAFAFLIGFRLNFCCLIHLSLSLSLRFRVRCLIRFGHFLRLDFLFKSRIDLSFFCVCGGILFGSDLLTLSCFLRDSRLFRLGCLGLSDFCLFLLFGFLLVFRLMSLLGSAARRGRGLNIVVAAFQSLIEVVLHEFLEVLFSELVLLLRGQSNQLLLHATHESTAT